MRISDWSSDVCSSDLHAAHYEGHPEARFAPEHVIEFIRVEIHQAEHDRGRCRHHRHESPVVASSTVLLVIRVVVVGHSILLWLIVLYTYWAVQLIRMKPVSAAMPAITLR